MFELFPDQPVYEFPTLVNVIYALAWAFALSTVIAITHKLTHKESNYPRNFFQALVLGSIVTAMVMMAVGDNLARGLGVFGAMAIIRFRTRIEQPRNILFLFASLSIGLAIGVYGYTIAFAGTFVFCLIAVLLHYSPFGNRALTGILTFTLMDESELPKALEVAQKYCEEMQNVNIMVSPENDVKYQYNVTFKKNIDENDFLQALRKVEQIKLPRIATRNVESN